MHSRFAPFVLLPLALTLGGCGYVHVGRLPEAPASTVGDPQLHKENSDLRLEKKLLQQELALSRAQGDALRLAIENRAADGDTSRRLTERLAETSRELAEVRASYAALKSERATAAASIGSDDPAILKTRLIDTQEKLAASDRAAAELNQEISQLNTALARARTENLTLAAQARAATAQNEQAQAALAKLNVELLAQRDARVRAEQDAETLRTELRTVAPNSSVLAQLRTGSAADARSLEPERAPESSTAASTSTASTPAAGKPLAVRSRTASISGPRITVQPGGVTATFVSPRTSASDAADASRVHTVAGGDTLAKISTQYYGTPSRWNDILTANRENLGENNTLVIGRILRIP